MAIGSVSFLLLLYIAFGSQLASQDNTKGGDNSATAIFIRAYAQSDNFDLNGTSEGTDNGTISSSGIDDGRDASQLGNTSVFKEVRGDVGGMIVDSAGGAIENQTTQVTGEEYVITGSWRIIVNQSILERFVTNLTIARTDGMESHNIIMEDVGPYFDLSSNGNIVTSEFPATIYRNNFNLTTLSASVQIEIKGNNIVQFAADIDDNSLPAGLQILRLLDEKPVYGTVQIVAIESEK
ncbi:MAG: hypothetical protein AB1351_05240 [Thermoproteota archaeon]